jgi:hypothetical protein
MQEIAYFETTSTLDMSITEQRIKGIETRLTNIGDRLSTIEGQLNKPAKGSNLYVQGGISFAAILLAGYLSWLGLSVVHLGHKLAEIIVLIAPEKLNEAASKPTNPQGVKEAKEILAIAKRDGKKLDLPTITDSGKKFADAGEKNKDSWDAALAFVNYRSYLNIGSLPTSQANFVEPPRGTIIATFKIDFEGPYAFDYFWDDAIVPIEQSFLYEKINEPSGRTLGHEFLMLKNGRGAGEIKIDGYRLKNVIFDGVRISYKGGPLILDNVRFINCTFDIAREPLGFSLAHILLGPNPSITYRAA